MNSMSNRSKNEIVIQISAMYTRQGSWPQCSQSILQTAQHGLNSLHTVLCGAVREAGTEAGQPPLSQDSVYTAGTATIQLELLPLNQCSFYTALNISLTHYWSFLFACN